MGFQLKLILSFAAAFCIAASLGTITFITVQSLISEFHEVERMQSIQSGLNELVSHLLAAESETRGFVITGNDDFLSKVKTERANAILFHAHTLRGSSLNVGARKLAELCKIIETDVGKGVDLAPTSLADVEQAHDAAAEELRAFLKSR